MRLAHWESLQPQKDRPAVVLYHQSPDTAVTVYGPNAVWIVGRAPLEQASLKRRRSSSAAVSTAWYRSESDMVRGMGSAGRVKEMWPMRSGLDVCLGRDRAVDLYDLCGRQSIAPKGVANDATAKCHASERVPFHGVDCCLGVGHVGEFDQYALVRDTEDREEEVEDHVIPFALAIAAVMLSRAFRTA